MYNVFLRIELSLKGLKSFKVKKESSLVAQTVKSLSPMRETGGSIPGLGRSSGEGKGNPILYSSLENLMDRGAWRATVHGGHKE